MVTSQNWLLRDDVSEENTQEWNMSFLENYEEENTRLN